MLMLTYSVTSEKILCFLGLDFLIGKWENISYFRRFVRRSIKAIYAKGSVKEFLINHGDHHLIFIPLPAKLETLLPHFRPG